MKKRSRKSRRTPSALILCNGERPSKRLLIKLTRESDLVVAADGGANVARWAGITPDVIIGDLDSIRPATRKQFSSSMVIHMTRQDNTDLEKALDFVVTRGMREAVVVAATGQRLDFTLGNLSVIWAYAGRLRIVFRDDAFTAVPVGKRLRIHARPGTTVSLIPFGACSGITLRGLRYPLREARMGVGEIGVSNVVERSPFTVQVRKGHMLLVLLSRSVA
jgi:thiamine pyrophosphokinase